MPLFDAQFFLDALAIVLIDIILAGDNAVVIAMAVQALPHAQRRVGIMAGAGLAVALRVTLTFFAAQLLQTQFVKLAGGTLVLWIGVKLLAESGGDEQGRQARNIWDAMWLILVADLTMSTDNILAIAGASKGSFGLVLFGLALSIPFVVFASQILSNLMDRYPAIMFIGSAVLGRVGGEMLLTDPVVVTNLHPAHWMEYAAQAVLAIAVVLAGWVLRKRNLAAAPSSGPA
ncbi:MAG: TerC family protein [Bryobacterales bacterium]|nr:TerC family protein [Bryobacterales bacterium]